jgi:very-short-patch-repair endonuclease
MKIPYVDVATGLLGSQYPLPRDQPFTRAQALSAGISARELSELVSQALVVRPLRGVYVASQTPDTPLLRAQALRLVVPEGFVVTDRTAGWLHGAPRILAPNDHLAVPRVSMVSAKEGNRLRNKLTNSGERAFGPMDLTVVHGIVVSTPLRTALDLGRLLHRDQAFAALDSLLRLGAFRWEELLENVERFKGYRGVVQLRALAPLADGRAESPGESVLRLRWLELSSMPVPQLQVPAPGPDGTYWLDLGVEASRFAAEYDGAEYHQSPEQEKHDERRRDHLRRIEGWTICVVRKANLFGQNQDVARLLKSGYRAALAALPSLGWSE